MKKKMQASRNSSLLIDRLQEEVKHRTRATESVDYNERYIDGGPAWGEHINYRDGGQHGQTHRPK